MGEVGVLYRATPPRSEWGIGFNFTVDRGRVYLIEFVMSLHLIQSR